MVKIEQLRNNALLNCEEGMVLFEGAEVEMVDG
jgi:hypothetical protein